jgi:two-component system sensor kinase FixL
MDVTEREQAREESKRMYDELLHAGRISTLGVLAGTLAHEINQPLSAIMSNAQAAKRFLDASDLAEVEEILPDIAGEAARAGEVINRLRAMLKKSATTFEPIDLNGVIAEVVGLLRRDAAARGVQLETALAPGPLWVHGDRIQLQQVVMNLMMNAFEAMDPRCRAARTVLLRTWREGAAVHAAVRDNGGGIAPDDLERIFNPYHTSKPDGMGMGLSICRSIVQRHQGHIRAETNAVGGATFYFTLPAA